MRIDRTPPKVGDLVLIRLPARLAALLPVGVICRAGHSLSSLWPHSPATPSVVAVCVFLFAANWQPGHTRPMLPVGRCPAGTAAGQCNWVRCSCFPIMPTASTAAISAHCPFDRLSATPSYIWPFGLPKLRIASRLSLTSLSKRQDKHLPAVAPNAEAALGVV